MKKLFLLRHAKSSWDSETLPHIARPLNEKGYRDAYAVSKQLLEMKEMPEQVMCSPAIRTYSTAFVFAQTIKFPVDQILIRKQLYDSNERQYLECIASAGDAKSVLIVGHNETITELAQKHLINRINELKTCTLICIEFDVLSWKEIAGSKGKLLFQLNTE